jgi:hypothetical protein
VPDFSIACVPSSLNIAAGANGTSTCTVTSINGHATPVNLSCVGQPLGVTCGFSANPVTPTGSSTLTVTVSGSQGAGTFNFQVRGTDGSLTHDAPIALTVPAVCLASGQSCTTNAQCCSNSCKGKPGAKTCK